MENGGEMKSRWGEGRIFPIVWVTYWDNVSLVIHFVS